MFATRSWLWLWGVVIPTLALAEERQIPVHLQHAQKLLKDVPLERTSYEHGEGRIIWSGKSECHTDCSGLIDHLLMHSYGYEKDQFKKWFDSRRPSAARYHQAIEEQHGFQHITKISHTRPGDLLAVKYLEKKENTGHVMLVVETPRRMNSKPPVFANTEQWEVRVIDSSRSGHGTSDTRHKQGSDGKDHDGLGEGIFRIYADPQEHVVGFTWSTYKNSDFQSPDKEHLVIGRLVPNFQP